MNQQRWSPRNELFAVLAELLAQVESLRCEWGVINWTSASPTAVRVENPIFLSETPGTLNSIAFLKSRAYVASSRTATLGCAASK
jgi:hypothetical protein